MQDKISRLSVEDQHLLEEVGRRIQFLRTARGLTLPQLAKAVGVSRPSISNVEKGRHMLNVVKLVKVARALQVSVIDLVPEDDSSVVNLRSGDRDRLSAIRRLVSELRPAHAVEDGSPQRLEATKALASGLPVSAPLTAQNKTKSKKGLGTTLMPLITSDQPPGLP